MRGPKKSNAHVSHLQSAIKRTLLVCGFEIIYFVQPVCLVKYNGTENYMEITKV